MTTARLVATAMVQALYTARFISDAKKPRLEGMVETAFICVSVFGVLGKEVELVEAENRISAVKLLFKKWEGGKI